MIARLNPRPRNLLISTLLLSALCLSFLFFPLQDLLDFGNRILPWPYGDMRPKSVMLIQYLKSWLPWLGLVLLVWLFLPKQIGQALYAVLTRTLDSRFFLPSTLLLTGLLAAAWIVFFPTKPAAGALWYFDTASALAQGLGYIHDLESLRPTALMPIGYPLFLAALFVIFGTSTLVGKIANIILLVFIVYATTSLTTRFFDHQVGRLAGLLLALLPGFTTYATLLLSDQLFMALVLAVLLLTFNFPVQSELRPTRWLLPGAIVGLLIGFAAQVRAVGWVLLPTMIVLAIFSIFRTRPPGSLIEKLRASLRPHFIAWSVGMAAAAIFVGSLWAIRNYIHFDTFILTDNHSGYTFYAGNNPEAFGGWYNPLGRNSPLRPYIDDEVALNEQAWALSTQWVRENPGDALALIPNRLFYLFLAQDNAIEHNNLSQVRPPQTGSGPRMYAFANLVYLVEYLIATLGMTFLVFGLRRTRLGHWFGLLFIFIWTTLHAPVLGMDRFMLPTLAFMVGYASYAILTLTKPDSPDKLNG